MKKHFKLLAALLALLMISTVFVACDLGLEEPEEEESRDPNANVELVPEDIDKKNYNEEFYMWILPDTNPMKFYWVEKSEGDAMSEAVYARQEKVRKYIGVEILASQTEGGHTTYTTEFKSSVKNKDGAVDTLMTHVHSGVAGLLSEMFVQDISELPGVDLDKNYWNREFMDAIAIDGNYYLGFSNYNILYTHVIAFNKEMMEQYAGSMEKSVYQLVNDYEWTLDQMLGLAQLVSSDRTGDGKTEDDTYGLTGQQWVPWIGFFHSSNINIVEMNEKGIYEFSFMNDVNSEKTTDLIAKLKDFSASKYGYFEFPSNGSIKAVTVPLSSKRTLMQLASTNGLDSLLKYDVTFGVLPYPMYDTNQKNVGYRSLQWGGYIAVPSYLRNSQMVGETLELLAFYSDEVMITFYEKMLGKQVADVPDDRKMLDIVWNSVCTDFGQTYADECGGILYYLPYVTWPGGEGKEQVSYLATFQNGSNRTLLQFVKQVTKQQTSSTQ